MFVEKQRRFQKAGQVLPTFPIAEIGDPCKNGKPHLSRCGLQWGATLATSVESQLCGRPVVFALNLLTLVKAFLDREHFTAALIILLDLLGDLVH